MGAVVSCPEEEQKLTFFIQARKDPIAGSTIGVGIEDIISIFAFSDRKYKPVVYPRIETLLSRRRRPRPPN